MADFTTTNWIEKMAFDSKVSGHTVRMDAKPKSGGEDTGPSPKPLVLTSLAGCTGMDVIDILRKMRVEFESLQIDVSGELTDEHPRVYKHILVTYRFSGNDLKMDKLEKAVTLSQEKYCGVTAMLRKNCPVEWRVEIQ